jgi:hypothetical protein
VKLNFPLLAPAMLSEVCTVTVSPAVNGVVGMKLPPCPSESDSIDPAWPPLLDPTTEIDPTWFTGIPRKVI